MTKDHIELESDILTVHEQAQEPRKKGADLKGSLDISIAQTQSSFSTKDQQQTLSRSDSDISAPSTPTKKPLVFKKPTKHKFTWEELTKLVAEKDLSPMARSEAVQEAYQRAIKRRTKKYGSPDEYIRQRVLHWPPMENVSSPSSPSTDSDDSSSSGSPPPSPTEPVDPLEFALKKNEFPYSVESGIEHWLIWSKNPLPDEDWIRRYLEERLPGREYLFFINPPELRSVPSIHHVQVFTKGYGEVLDEEDLEAKKDEDKASR